MPLLCYQDVEDVHDVMIGPSLTDHQNSYGNSCHHLIVLCMPSNLDRLSCGMHWSPLHKHHQSMQALDLLPVVLCVAKFFRIVPSCWLSSVDAFGSPEGKNL